MIALLQQVADMAKLLTDGTEFTTNVNNQAEIVYHEYVMPPRPQGQTVDVSPFCLVKVRGFTLYPRQGQQIELLYCLYNEDRAMAMADMATLAGLVKPIARRGQQFGGWKLTEISGYAGEEETGVQPHPEYYLTVLLSFTAPPIN